MKSPKWSLSFRIWHWLHAVVILGLLGTVFLRETFLNKRTNGKILLQKLESLHLHVTQEQAVTLAKAIRAPMWEWHIWLGYALGILVLWRIALFFTESGKRNYRALSKETLHKKAVKLGYLLLYLLLSFMVLSGLFLTFYKTIGVSKNFAHDIKELHEAAYYAVLFFVPLHIAGVFIADATDEKCIVSDMINGGEA